MQDIIKKAVNKFNKLSSEIELEYPKSFKMADVKNGIKITIQGELPIYRNVDEFLLNPKFRFLRTLIGDEMVCVDCGKEFIKHDSIREGIEKVVYWRCGCDVAFTDYDNEPMLPKHQYIAERLFRLIYENKDGKGEEEAVKLLNTFL